MREHVPAVKATISTWSQLCNTAAECVWPEGTDDSTCKRQEERLRALWSRLGGTTGGGQRQVLSNLFAGLFTDGAFAAEIVPSRVRQRVEALQWIDPATLELKPGKYGAPKLYQAQGGRNVRLDSPAVYFQPLHASADRPEGMSILSAVPFIARVEQRLVSDLSRAMHNAGYARLHVKLTPPVKQPGEGEAAYAARASAYFDDTVRQLRELEPDDNAITWNDVEIANVEAMAKSTTQSGWFVNHRALIEEICAATHLAPFMLGYSFGTTQSWGRFKYGMTMRMAAQYQELAARFVEWLASIELALGGETVFPAFRFERPEFLSFVEEQQAEKLRTEIVIAQRDAGLISEDDARQRLAL
jgi:hypothetical protein